LISFVSYIIACWHECILPPLVCVHAPGLSQGLFPSKVSLEYSWAGFPSGLDK
jgi:hypothetical protein